MINSKRKGNLEARICNESLMEIREGDIFTIEIVQWDKNKKGKEFCWVIAHFKPYREDGEISNYDLEFCGDRPFDEKVNWEDFRILTESSYRYLKALSNF